MIPRFFTKTAFAAAVLSATLYAHECPVEDTLALPHPFFTLNQPSWKERLTTDQKKAIETLKSQIAPRFQGKVGDAVPYQDKMLTAVFDRNQQAPLNQEDIKTLSRMKNEMLAAKVDAYNGLKKILSEKEWEEFVKEVRAQ